MKLKSLFILLILGAANFHLQAQRIALPYECAKILDRRYKGWQFAEIGDDIMQWFQSSRQPYRPNLIKGDWNGDRRIDYAALIENAKTGTPGSGHVLAVFLRNTRGYTLYKLEGSDYIAFINKGSRDYNYETDQTFIYRNDAIFTGFFEKAGISYTWQKGKFVALVTSD